jgi:hypothetical protein
MTSVTYIMLMRQVYFFVYNSTSLTFCGYACHADTKSKCWVQVFLACNVGDSAALLPLVFDSYTSSH